MTSQRWWAPQRGTTEPDAVVLSLLERPGDLATTLLAAHRAGAAACEAVAQAPVPSEAALVRAMATARAAFAGPVMDVIAKSMETNYAGLLVRDVLSAAESATLALYRSAVAKGVSPPIAASRAGAVYGVPSREMGKYAALAGDPKANPVALVDAADRTLLGYVAKLAASEADGQLVEFSKAPAPVMTMARTATEWDEREHPRGDDGRFTGGPPAETTTDLRQGEGPAYGSPAWVRQRLGLGTQSAPVKVAGTDSGSVPVTQPVQSPAQTRPKLRRARTVRRVRQVSKPQPEVDQRSAQGVAQRSSLTRSQVRQASVTQQARSKKAYRKAHQNDPKPDLTPDLLAHLQGGPPESYHELYHSLTMVAPSSVMDTVVAKMRDQAGLFADPNGRILRIGHLEHFPNVTETANSADHASIIKRLKSAAAEAWAASAAPEPDIDLIHPNDFSGAGQRELADLLDKEVKEKATKIVDLGGKRRRVPDKAAEAFTFGYREYEELFGAELDEDNMPVEKLGHAIVQWRPTDPRRPAERDIVAVDEIVILDPQGRLEGSDLPGSTQTHSVLDPNQAYRLVPPPGMPMEEYEEFFLSQDEANVVVRRWRLEKVSEDRVDEIRGGDVGKALMYADAMVFEQLHPRDEHGQFAETRQEAGLATQSTPTIAPAHARQPRKVRSVRRVRQLRRAARAKPAIQGVEERAAQRSATHAPAQQATAFQATMLARAIARAAVRQKILPELHDTSDYRLLTNDVWTEWADKHFTEADQAELLAGGELTLYSPARADLATAGALNASDLPSRMAYNVHDDMNRNEDMTKVLKSVPRHAVNDDEVLAKTVDELFDRHPEVDIIEILQLGNRINFHGNEYQARDQNIIEIDPDVDWDKTVYMTYVDSYRARDMSMVDAQGNRHPVVDVETALGGPQERGGEGAVPNPELHIFRVTSAKVRRFRASND